MELPLTERVAAHVTAVESTASTNTLAQDLLRNGRLNVAPGQVAVVATERQTAGRGRLDHTWVSHPGQSFTMSFVATVPRAVALDETVNGWLQMIAGLSAVAGLNAAIRAHGMRLTAPLRLKWPNDVFLDGKKLGGILCQLVTDRAGGSSSDANGGNVAIIMGIGLNLAVPRTELPTDAATSLHLHIQSPADGHAHQAGPAPSDVCASMDFADAIASGIVAALAERITAFAADPGAQSARLRDETESLCLTLGRRTIAHFTDGSELTGLAVGLNPDASLTIRADDGVEHTVTTADVGVL